MAKFLQVALLAFLVAAMVVPHEAFFHVYKHKSFHPKHYVAKHHSYVPVVHRPVYYKAVPVYAYPKRKFYKKKKHFG